MLGSTLLVASLAASAQAFPMMKEILGERGLSMDTVGGILDLSKRSTDEYMAFSHVQRDHIARNLEGLRKKELQKRQGLLGGLLGGSVLSDNAGLGPLSGLLQALDIPTPQPVGLLPVPDGAHPFVAPGPTDVRGLCPTLNTMANHGYISRSGITTFAEAANGCQQAYGFGYDICVGLSALGLLAGGDIVSGKYSISGADARVPNTLGQNQGIAVHGPFEIDGSITRADTYFGDNHSFNQTLWDAWVAQCGETSGGLFDFTCMAANQKYMYEQSKATNPEAYFGVKYFVVALAERVFIPAALPNGTTQEVSDFANVAPFFLEERFPKGWFKRGDVYSAADTVTDVLSLYAAAPFELGSNQGGVFTAIPGGIPTTPAGVMCFLLDAIFDALPSSLAGEVAGNAPLYTAFAQGILGPLFGSGTSFNCDVSDYGIDQGSGSNPPFLGGGAPTTAP